MLDLRLTKVGSIFSLILNICSDGFRAFGCGAGCANALVLGENILFDKIFAENCMKLKEIGPGGGGLQH